MFHNALPQGPLPRSSVSRHLLLDDIPAAYQEYSNALLLQSLLSTVAELAISHCKMVTKQGPSVVMRGVAPHDQLNLRQVDRSVYRSTTQLIPRVTLRLSSSSTAAKLYKWIEATQRLQHVTCIYIYIAGEVAEGVLNLAMQLLSQRYNAVQELHLLADNSGSSVSSSHSITPPPWAAAGVRSGLARLPTLQPLQHLIPFLHSLVVEDITVQDMSNDLRQLTAAGVRGWRLRSLHLVAAWQYPVAEAEVAEISSSAFSSALRCLPVLFPRLEQLALSVPDWHVDPPFTDLEVLPFYQRSVLPEVPIISALVQTVMQLPGLEQLTVTPVPGPEVWKQPPSASQGFWDCQTFDTFACWLLQHHPRLMQLRIGAAHVGWGMFCQWQQQQQEQPPAQQLSLCGRGNRCNLRLAANPDMLLSDVMTMSANVCHYHLRPVIGDVAADQPHYGNGSNIAGSSAGSGTIGLLDRDFISYMSTISSRPASVVMHNITSLRLTMSYLDANSLTDFLDDFKSLKHLGITLWRKPDTFIITHTSSSAAAKVTTAAATVPGLETLTLDIKGGAQRLSADVLLPLTAAAPGGGPGSSCLKTLKLHAELEAATLVDRMYDVIAARAAGIKQLSVDNLKRLALRLQAIFAANHSSSSSSSSSATPAAARRDTAGTLASGTAAATSSAAASATAVAAVSHVVLPREPSTHNNDNKQLTTAASITSAPAAVGPGSKWHHALWQLSGLTHLIITHDGTADSLLDLPVQSLPTSLQVLEGNSLNILDAGSKRFLAVSNLEPANGSVCRQVALNQPQLRVLKLLKCHLRRPSILTSCRLHHLSVINCSWSGGWAAAATAWPNPKELNYVTDTNFHEDHYQCDSRCCCYSSLGSVNLVSRPLEGAKLCVEQEMYDLCTSLRQLTALTIRNVPWLTVEAMQLIVQHLHSIRHVCLDICRAENEVLAVSEGLGYVQDVEALGAWLQQQIPGASVCVAFSKGRGHRWHGVVHMPAQILCWLLLAYLVGLMTWIFPDFD